MNLRKQLVLFEQRFWDRRRSNLAPSLFQQDYLAHISLTTAISAALKDIKKNVGKRKLKIVDIGCGDKPYLPLFLGMCSNYIGVDLAQPAEITAPAEKVPLASGSFDLVVCFQVLEHLSDPHKAVEEMYRLLKKNGRVIASTHGIWQHHPMPHDYWRWTDEGLEKLFSKFRKVSIKPNLLSYPSLIQLLNQELYGIACRHLVLKIPLYVLIYLLNLLGKLIINQGQKHLSINYLIVAQK